MNLLAQFIDFIKQECLFEPAKDKVILAVSGGSDSVVLAHLFAKAGYHFALAHCNFQLRGAESDGDQQFVENLALELGVPFFVQSFDSQALAKEKGTSIQVVARALRYEWLEEIRVSNAYQYLATAHHLNDSIETLLYNLSKGCGIKGLHGILPKNESTQIIRPLLFANKAAIQAFISEQEIQFREDSSNVSLKYVRNKIRNQWIPLIQEINPAFETTFQGNIERFRETEWLYQQAVQDWKNKLLETKNLPEHVLLSIDKTALEALPVRKTLLYEILAPYGFGLLQIEQILAALSSESGAVYNSSTHRLLRDRAYLLLTGLKEEQNSLSIHKDKLPLSVDEPITIPLSKHDLLKIELVSHPKNIDQGKYVFYFNAEALSWPLIIRTWEQGDQFSPFGLGGKHKKISKLLKDEKLSLFQKENVWLLATAAKIYWVLGLAHAHSEEPIFDPKQGFYKMSYLKNYRKPKS